MASRQSAIPLIAARIQSRPRGLYNLLRSFQFFHRERSNEITKHDFIEGCKKFGIVLADEELEEAFHDIDSDNNGAISHVEFVKMFSTIGVHHVRAASEQHLLR